jgi:two-component sensor histidine kinase
MLDADDALEAVSASGSWELDPATGRMRLSPGAAALHELAEPIPAALLTRGAWLARVHPDDRAVTDAALEATLRDGVPLRHELRIRRRDGGFRWIECRGALRRGEGEAARLLALDIDVTARRESEARAALGLREVEHRAKNALSTAQALVRLTRAEDPAEFARLVQRRLAALGRAHARLTAAPPGAGHLLRDIAAEEFTPYGRDAVLLRGPELALAAPAVQPVCMALHELATNAAKHGALSRVGGIVHLGWRRLGDGALLLAWREAGGPPPGAVPGRGGFGMALLDALLRGQLGGRLRFTWRPAGLRLSAVLPAACLAGD